MNTIRHICSALSPSRVVQTECKVIRLRPWPARAGLACRWQEEADGRLSCVWERVSLPPKGVAERLLASAEFAAFGATRDKTVVPVRPEGGRSARKSQMNIGDENERA